MKNETIRVPLGQRAYEIHIGDGLLAEAGSLLAPVLRRPRIIIVTDENVLKAQGERLKSGLNARNISSEFIALAPGENAKSFAELERLTSRLLDLGVERDDTVAAFGGGVVGDLTGFACSMLRRGCGFVQIPTSLLAQVDSAVGGKTAINMPQGKNLIGAFYQPEIVIADVGALETLPIRELRAGYAEIVKYGLISNADFFEWLEDHGSALIGGDAKARIHAVKTSCAAKAAIVADDEREKGKRALLNLGHTFGHAFEAAFGYSDKLLHGEAVALGMTLAFDYSARLGRCRPEDAERVKRHLKTAGLPCAIRDLPQDLKAASILDYMMQDKKIEQGALTLVLAEKIGSAMIVKNADSADILEFLKEKTGA
ncbi:3-dehydroquinate synthase [Hyphococcus sp.]|uniref:3-dehydroquinate synthase n=1 Tax=Hyphococcus sp. TaxID=2038636 RepID=UPI003CCB9772